MSFFKEAGESFVKYGEIFVNKTEKLMRIAKIKLDIKKIEYEMDRIEQTLGAAVVDAVAKGSSALDLTLENIKENCAKINDMKKTIESKNAEIDEIKKSFTD